MPFFAGSATETLGTLTSEGVYSVDTSTPILARIFKRERVVIVLYINSRRNNKK